MVWQVPHRARYGGVWFEAATALQLEGGLSRPGRVMRLLAAAARRPGRLYALVALVRETPSEPVRLSTSEAGRALRAYFGERFLGFFPQNRLCRGVLILPDDYGSYHRGRRRQALRTNLRRADEAGVSCERLADPVSGIAALKSVLAARKNTAGDPDALLVAWQPHFSQAASTIFVARDRDGEPQAVIAAVIDSDVCLIQFAGGEQPRRQVGASRPSGKNADRSRRQLPAGRGRRAVRCSGLRTRACTTTSICWATSFATWLRPTPNEPNVRSGCRGPSVLRPQARRELERLIQRGESDQRRCSHARAPAP